MHRLPWRWIQRRLLIGGIEVRKFPTAEFKPLRVFDLAVQAIMATRGQPLRFVQVGANDGSFVDPLRPYIMQCGWRGILIEPQPDVFERLVFNYAAYMGQLAFENVAISSGDALTLYLPPVDLDETEKAVHARSVVSADPRVIGRQLGVSINRLRRIEVPSITLEALFYKHGVDDLDVLQIDAEGFDWAVLQTFDLRKLAPRVIQVETGHLKRSELGALTLALTSNGYEIYYGGHQGDLVALREDVIIGYQPREANWFSWDGGLLASRPLRSASPATL